MTGDAQRLTARLGACADRTEAMLAALLVAPPDAPERLYAAMQHAALGGGKRLRPFLVVETAAMFGAVGEGALRTACALEMIHCYSLVHDDLPAMDDDDLRRGRPTVHIAFDEATAILAGDSLLTLAFEVLADPRTEADASLRAALVLAFARGAGPSGMAGGQALDLAAEAATTPLGTDAVRHLQALKTGALLACAVDAGALIGRADAAQKTALTVYGRALGAAFQIADDILDATGDTAKLGKKAGKDAGRNKATLVATLGLDGARAACETEVRSALAALETLGPLDTTLLAEAARFVASRDT